MTKNVPMILQMENAECGAASLLMILRYFGRHDKSLEQMRIECGVSRDGVTAKGIKAAAEKNGLKCRVFRASPDSVKTLAMPVILHWDMAHFVVLTGFGKKKYYINDPAYGKMTVSKREFNERFTGIAMAFEKTENFVHTGKKKEFSFTFRTLKPFVPVFLLVSFFGAVVMFFGMLLPYFDSVFLDVIVLAADRSVFHVFALFFASTVLLRAFFDYAKERIVYESERELNIRLSVGFMGKMLKLPITFFSQRTPGELANRQLGSFEISELLCKHIAPVFFQAVLIALFCTAAFKFNVGIALIGAAAVLLNALISVVSSKRISGTSALDKKNAGRYQSAVASAIDMMDTIKSCACEETMFNRLAGTAALNLQTITAKERIKLYSAAAFEFVNFIVSIAVLVTGGIAILNGEFSIGVTVALIGMFAAFLVPVGAFVNSISAIYDLKSISERTDDTMKYSDEDIFLKDGGSKTMDGSLTADNVGFAYSGTAVRALRNVSFKVEKGKSLAVTGASGSGKSTLIKLISGLYTETEGHIYYGDAEKKDLTKEYFYSKIAVVGQSAKMYEGTVLENITMWNRDYSYDDVVDACKTACIHDEIIARPDAYSEMMTEDGANFSGGQKQRIEIARALLHDPEILVLDEATSALDAVTEERLTENILALGKTLIVVAHRMSTIKNCGEILVLKDGEIAERGTHASLMEKNGIYAELNRNI